MVNKVQEVSKLKGLDQIQGITKILPEIGQIPGLGKIIPDLSKIQGLDNVFVAVQKAQQIAKLPGMEKIAGARELLPVLSGIPGIGS